MQILEKAMYIFHFMDIQLCHTPNRVTTYKYNTNDSKRPLETSDFIECKNTFFLEKCCLETKNLYYAILINLKFLICFPANRFKSIEECTIAKNQSTC